MICICDAYGPNSINRCPIRGHGVLDMMSSASKFQPLKGHAMPRYTVNASVQGTEIVTINYLTDGNALDMMSAVANALAHDEPDNTPWSVRTLAVTVTVNYPEA